ncbi:unnamed protein product [Malus baccata var. baccata]
MVQGSIETQGLCGVSKKKLRVHEICLKSGPNLVFRTDNNRIRSIRLIGGAMRGAGAEQLSVLKGTQISVTVSSVNKMLQLETILMLKLLHLSKPGISTGVVPTAAAAAASLLSDGGVDLHRPYTDQSNK